MRNAPLRRRVSDYCRMRLSPFFPPRDVEALTTYLLELVDRRTKPPLRGQGIDWGAISSATGIAIDDIRQRADDLRPVLALLARELPKSAPRRVVPAPVEKNSPAKKPRKRARMTTKAIPKPAAFVKGARRGPKPKPFVEFPEASNEIWEEPTTFGEALALHMRRHGDNCADVQRAVISDNEVLDRATIASWRRGSKTPQSKESMAVLGRIERRYRLPEGYFKAKLPHPNRSTTGQAMIGIAPSERRRIAWHLPDDFDRRPLAEQEKILEWVREVVVSGSTSYRRYQAAAMKNRFALRFPQQVNKVSRHRSSQLTDIDDDQEFQAPTDPALSPGPIRAPQRLVDEMTELLSFKTSTLAALGFQRTGVWGEQTALQKVEHLGLLFGALSASPQGPVRGYGVPLRHLTLSMLVFPAVWDWYVQWRERRRGFYTAWEVDMLRVAQSLARRDTGWLRQRPDLAGRLQPIAGLVSRADIEDAQRNWGDVCERFFHHANARAKEIQRVARVHRDPFEPILAVLEAASPVGEYRKITEEIIRLMPDERRYPKAAAEAVRSFLMLRLGLHLGLRQKNLRQLMLCPIGCQPRSERELTDTKRGEIRWNTREGGWEVFIPSAAFKNARSSFFGSKPYRLILPDLGGLYGYIDTYIGRHRQRLLAGAVDPGVFFVKTVKASSRDAAYDQNTFYEAWRLAIQRYGIHNPYTGRGVIKGLLPHGPHNVRDVLATHILKQTGSYEQASYAIQDTPDMVAKHYGRFLPQDKAAMAAQILNQVWEAA